MKRPLSRVTTLLAPQRAIALITFVFLLSLAVAAPVAAHPSRNHSVTFTSLFTDDGTRVRSSAECDGHAPDRGSITYEGTARLNGDLTAVDNYCGFMSYDLATSSVVGQGWDTMSGFLPGCGTGSFIIHQADYHTSPTFYDPTTGRGHLTLRWTVVPGSGTQNFTGATGSGTAYADFDPPTDLTHPLAVPNRGAYTGTITCPRGH